MNETYSSASCETVDNSKPSLMTNGITCMEVAGVESMVECEPPTIKEQL